MNSDAIDYAIGLLEERAGDLHAMVVEEANLEDMDELDRCHAALRILVDMLRDKSQGRPC